MSADEMKCELASTTDRVEPSLSIGKQESPCSSSGTSAQGGSNINMAHSQHDEMMISIVAGDSVVIGDQVDLGIAPGPQSNQQSAAGTASNSTIGTATSSRRLPSDSILGALAIPAISADTQQQVTTVITRSLPFVE